MSQEQENVAVGHEWADDAKVVLTGKQFRQIINLMNQYPQMLAQVFQNFFEQSSDLFAKTAEELEGVVKFLYTYHPGLPRIISDHWGGAPEEPPSVELIAATFQGRDVLPLITEDAMDVITDRILSLEGVL